MAKKKKLDVSKMSDDELVDKFESVYEQQVASINDVTSYECTCKRDSSTSEVRIEVMVVGMAGSPTLDEYKDGKVENSSRVVLEVEDRGVLKLDLVADEIISLNTNDYVAVYKVV